MKKINREFIDRFGNDSYCTCLYSKPCNTYYIRRDYDGLILAIGKELKGYLGDIIYVGYDGYIRDEKSDYILMSDRHGMICKWKGEKR